VGPVLVLAEIKRLAELGRIVFTHHARLRMLDRGATVRDVRNALLCAEIAVPQRERDNWRVEGGVDLDGDDLTVIVDLEADVVVVTLF